MPVTLIPLSCIFLYDRFSVSFVVQCLYFILKSSLLTVFVFFVCVCVLECLYASSFLTYVNQGLRVFCVQLVLSI
jgi:hypothetical protein